MGVCVVAPSMAVVLCWVCVSCYKDLSYLRASGQTTRASRLSASSVPQSIVQYTHTKFLTFNPHRSIYTHFHLKL